MEIKRCYETIIGASVGENQLVQNGNFADTSGWTTYGTTFTTSNNEATITFPSTRTGILGQQVSFTTGHKYLTAVSIKGDATYSAIYCMLGSGLAVHEYDISTTYKREQFIFNYNSTSNNFNILRTNASNSEKIYIKNAVLIDITAMLGSSIADYIYSLEQATAGSGLAWLRSYGFLMDDYVPYNAGTIESVEATAKVVRDENNENAVTYPLGSDVLRGIFKLSNGKLYADGDRKEADGTITRKYGVVDLGTLNWVKNSTYTGLFNSEIKNRKISIDIPFICSKYARTDSTSVINQNLSIAFSNGAHTIFVHDDAYTDAVTFTTAMSGVMLVYELATPTTEQSTPFTSPQIVYPDGTEEFVTENGVPVGHETKYQL